MSSRRGAEIRSASVTVVTIALAALAAISVAMPLAAAGVDLARGALDGSSSPAGDSTAHHADGILQATVIVRTLAWSLGIGIASTAIAWPTAWALTGYRFGRGARRGTSSARPRGVAWAWVWLIVPMCMPTYLAYAGYGLLRAPGTALGDWLGRLARADAGSSSLAALAREAPVIAGQALAYVGLALWCWPIATLILASSASRVDPGVFESLRLDGAGRWESRRARVRLLRTPIVISVLAVCVLMLGSAVPLHLAQVQTLSIRIWLALDNSGPTDRWRAWAVSWPLIVAALLSAWWVGGAAIRSRVFAADARGVDERGSIAGLSRRRFVGAIVPPRAMWIPWAIAVAVPMALFAGSLREFDSLRTFWRVNADAMSGSAVVAASVAFVGSIVCLGFWCTMSTAVGSRRVAARIALTVLAVGGLMPGVLVGASTTLLWTGLSPRWEVARWVSDTPTIVVLCHAARFAWIPALIGCALSSLESPEIRDQRRLDAAVGVASWWRTEPGRWIPAACAGGFAGVLSLHEIESSVMVQPPGIDSLARRVLQFLHFSRMEDLSAAAIWMIGGGLVLAGGLAVMAEWVIRTRGARTTARPNEYSG